MTLAYLGVDPRGLGPRLQADALLRLLHYPGILLILDGFERALRAYSSIDAAYQGDDPAERETQATHHASRFTQHDCISPIAEHFLRSVACLPGMRGKVLMTTRLRPRILEAYGGGLLQGCHEEELTQMQPADAVAYDALRAVAEQTPGVLETPGVLAEFDTDLRDLVARGLLHHDRQTNRYDLHPIVRRYAYDRLGGAERMAAHGQLRDYFASAGAGAALGGPGPGDRAVPPHRARRAVRRGS